MVKRHLNRLIFFATFFLLAVLVFAGISFGGVAHSESVDFKEGDGTAQNPYRISTTQEFDRIRYHRDANFKQITNLDFSSYDNFAPIGSVSFPFTGRYDGAKYSINNLTIKQSESNIGLFSFVSKGEILDLKIKNSNVEGRYNVGSIVGTNKGRVKGCIADTKVNGDKTIGGIVGLNSNGGVVEECGFLGSIVDVDGNESGMYTGGIAGINNSIIKNCYNQGNININYDKTAPIYSGGIVGLNNGETVTAVIEKSYNVGIIGGNARGQIAGDNIQGKIDNCKWEDSELTYISTFNTGSVTNTMNMPRQMFGNAESFGSWLDFNDIWNYAENANYPTLKREYVPVESIKFNSASVRELHPGESYTVNAAVYPLHATVQDIEYEIVDPSGAAEYEELTNKVTIKEDAAIGSKITIYAVAEGVKSELQIGVIKTPVEHVELVNESGRTTIAFGVDLNFNANIYPNNASYRDVTYSVNSSYAGITQNGVLNINENTPIGIQLEVKVIASDNSSVYDTIVIDVVSLPVENVVITAKSSFKVAESLELNAEVLPNNANDNTVSYAIVSSTAKGARLMNNMLYADGSGYIAIVAFAGGVYSNEFVIEVKKEPVTLIEFDTADSFICGNALILRASAKPEKATFRDITFTILSDTATASIIDGVLYAEHDGIVIVRATADGVCADKEIIVHRVKVEEINFLCADSFKHTEKLSLNIEVLPKNATYKQLKISLENNTADAYILDGELFAKKPGNVKLIAETDGMSSELTIVVMKESVIGVDLSVQYLDSDVGELLQFSAEVYPANATYKDVKYFLKSGQATLSEDGLLLIDIKSPIGSLIEIYAVADGVESIVYSVHSGKIEVREVCLTTSADSMRVGETVDLSVNIMPLAVSNPGVTYEVIGNAEVINGIVYVNDLCAVGQTIVITAIVDGMRSKSVSIPVEKTPVTNLLFTSETNFKITEELKLSANVYPIDATYQEVHYTIINGDDAGASIRDGYLQAERPGIIKLKIEADGISREIIINAIKEPVTDIILTSLKSVKVFYELNLTSMIYPINATNKTVRYELLDNTIGAELYNENIFYSENIGFVTIRVYADDIYRDFNIEVIKEAVTDIRLNSAKTFKHTIGLELSASVLPFNATYREITFEIINGQDNARIENGYLYARTPGSVTLRLNADGIYRDYTIDIVKEAVTNVELIGENNLMLNTGCGLGELSLSSIVYPSNATYSNVTYQVMESNNCTVTILNGKLYVALNSVLLENGIAKEVQATTVIRSTADGVFTDRTYKVHKNAVTDIEVLQQKSYNDVNWADTVDRTIKTSGKMRFTIDVQSEFATYKKFEIKYSYKAISDIDNVTVSIVKDNEKNTYILTADKPCYVTVTVVSLCNNLNKEFHFTIEEETVTEAYLGAEIIKVNEELDGKVNTVERGGFTPTANYTLQDIGNYKNYTVIEAQQGSQFSLRAFANALDTALYATYGHFDYLEMYYVANGKASKFFENENNDYFTYSGGILTVKVNAPVTKSFFIYARAMHGEVVSEQTEIIIQSKYITEINNAFIADNGKVEGLEGLNQVGGVEKLNVIIRHTSGIVIEKTIFTNNPTLCLQLFNPTLGGRFSITYTVFFNENNNHYSYVLPKVKEFSGINTIAENQCIESYYNSIVLLDFYSGTPKQNYNIYQNVKSIYVYGNGELKTTSFTVENDGVNKTEMFLNRFSFRAPSNFHAINITSGIFQLNIKGDSTIRGGASLGQATGYSGIYSADKIVLLGERLAVYGGKGGQGKTGSIGAAGYNGVQNGEGYGTTGGMGDDGKTGETGYDGGAAIKCSILEVNVNYLYTVGGDGGQGGMGGNGGKGGNGGHGRDATFLVYSRDGGNGGRGGTGGRGGIGGDGSVGIAATSIVNNSGIIINAFGGNAGAAGIGGYGGAGGSGGCGGKYLAEKKWRPNGSTGSYGTPGTGGISGVCGKSFTY